MEEAEKGVILKLKCIVVHVNLQPAQPLLYFSHHSTLGDA
jgi:hypothetical protein